MLGLSHQNAEIQFGDNFRRVVPQEMLEELQDQNYVFLRHKYDYGIVPLHGDQEIILKTPIM